MPWSASFAVVASAAAILIGTWSQISSAPKPGEEPAADTSGPNINGTYRVDYDAKAQTKNGKPVPVDPIPAFAWSFHSACPDTGCVATASRLRGGGTDIQIVLDFVGGRWVEAHMAEAGSCPGGGTAPHLTSWSLAPGRTARSSDRRPTCTWAPGARRCCRPRSP